MYVSFQYFVFLIIIFAIEAAAGIIGFVNYDKVGLYIVIFDDTVTVAINIIIALLNIKLTYNADAILKIKMAAEICKI